MIYIKLYYSEIRKCKIKDNLLYTLKLLRFEEIFLLTNEEKNSRMVL